MIGHGHMARSSRELLIFTIFNHSWSNSRSVCFACSIHTYIPRYICDFPRKTMAFDLIYIYIYIFVIKVMITKAQDGKKRKKKREGQWNLNEVHDQGTNPLPREYQLVWERESTRVWTHNQLCPKEIQSIQKHAKETAKMYMYM